MENFINLRVERSFSDKLNATFTFARQNIKQLSITLLLLGFPLLVAGNILLLYMQTTLQQTLIENSGAFNWDYLSTMMLSMSLLMLGYFWLHLITISYMAEYADGNRNISPTAVMNRAFANLGKVLGAGIISVIIIAIGFVFLIIPGIYLSIVLSLLTLVIVMEGDPSFEAISRCFYLINGKWWSTFGLLIIMGIIVSMMQFAFNIPTTIITFTKAFHQELPTFDLTNILANIFSTLGLALIYPLSYIALAFQYFNLVELKESAGLKLEIEQSANTVAENQEGEY